MGVVASGLRLRLPPGPLQLGCHCASSPGRLASESRLRVPSHRWATVGGVWRAVRHTPHLNLARRFILLSLTEALHSINPSLLTSARPSPLILTTKEKTLMLKQQLPRHSNSYLVHVPTQGPQPPAAPTSPTYISNCSAHTFATHVHVEGFPQDRGSNLSSFLKETRLPTPPGFLFSFV